MNKLTTALSNHDWYYSYESHRSSLYNAGKKSYNNLIDLLYNTYSDINKAKKDWNKYAPDDIEFPITFTKDSYLLIKYNNKELYVKVINSYDGGNMFKVRNLTFTDATNVNDILSIKYMYIIKVVKENKQYIWNQYLKSTLYKFLSHYISVKPSEMLISNNRASYIVKDKSTLIKKLKQDPNWESNIPNNTNIVYDKDANTIYLSKK